MPPISRIYLTGFMGSGKSTLGVKLAIALGYVFVDLDEEIERATGMPIQDIFARDGETAFRIVEKNALCRTFERDRIVVAVGGGALAAAEQMDAALQNGVVVYLSAKEDTLRNRLRSSRKSRPLLPPDLRIDELLEKRDPVYRRAQVVLPVDGLSVKQASHALYTAVSRYGTRE